MGHGPIRTRPWKRPPWKRRQRRPGEYNVISQATAAAMAGSSPFRDGSCGQIVDLPEGLTCDETVAFVPTILSSAAEGDLAGQPLWPAHTVESVRGEIFFFKVGSLAVANQVKPGQGCLVHLGMRKTRFDYDAVTPSFETDFDPAHEDDAEARWIWTKHLFIPPSPSPDHYSSTGTTAVTGGGFVVCTFDGATHCRAQVTVNERNRVKLNENEGLVLHVTVSQDPWWSLFATAELPLGPIHGNQATIGMKPFLRTYVRQSK